MALELAPLGPRFREFLGVLPSDEQVRVRLTHVLPFDPRLAHELTLSSVPARHFHCFNGVVATKFHDQFFEHKGDTFEHVDSLP